MLFTGNSNIELAKQISICLKTNLGRSTVNKFSDGEISVEIEENVRGKDIFIIQSTCVPTNNNLIELILIIDALRRASATRITAVIPYLGYSRQDRRIRTTRVPISAKVIADMIVKAGVNRVMTMDLHADQIQGFFDVPVDNIYGSPVFITDIETQKYKNLVIVSPDIGGVVRARALAKKINADLSIIDKRRPKKNQTQVMNIIGDIKERTCILIDDIVDTASTLCKAAESLKKQGAKYVFAYITHAILSGNALNIINNSVLDKLIVTDTIPLSTNAMSSKKIKQISVASIIAEAIRRVNNEESISEMFN
ncbi:ribose-phosphate pyrophosphokinase [Candidatus Portiera aleyrodidarum MED (Bemisia tabaci)]|uniref:Ribose-phosphate pyrophosphokinase n=2 Tax=Candidatus Portiera aleyrodidarum TaxID=91844 RepID=A0AAU8RZ82_9GAMM|nr:ribose-phosphate pyrophosphokinase [Candidatus Portiera aleyrodidarum MED (Bemisia tabaci)]ASX27343.1 ribose-phosphate pyrophosphokinase [Candidatus Portiera aleyrodidarum MED (Bemisia tabaci)]AUI73158.1 ribose-phosphate pyrophosphokinase [Candidatus Portiera aleyrodidarum]AUI73405.1 ribose-phosphate pyrophosphokinase [Candidatus Portiera aleyrodidarum]